MGCVVLKKQELLEMNGKLPSEDVRFILVKLVANGQVFLYYLTFVPVTRKPVFDI